jgi:hypothetical protein
MFLVAPPGFEAWVAALPPTEAHRLGLAVDLVDARRTSSYRLFWKDVWVVETAGHRGAGWRGAELHAVSLRVGLAHAIVVVARATGLALPLGGPPAEWVSCLERQLLDPEALALSLSVMES